MDIRAKLFENIVLSGATTMFAGFASRIEKDIKEIYKEKALKNTKDKNVKINIKIIDSPRRKYSVFIGATVLANTYNTDAVDYWITKQDWDECGPEIIKKKCPNVIN